MFPATSNFQGGAGDPWFYWVDPEDKSTSIYQIVWSNAIYRVQKLGKEVLSKDGGGPLYFFQSGNGQCGSGSLIEQFTALARANVRRTDAITVDGKWGPETADLFGFLLCKSGNVSAAQGWGADVAAKRWSPESLRYFVWLAFFVSSSQWDWSQSQTIPQAARNNGAGIAIPAGTTLPSWTDTPSVDSRDAGWFAVSAVGDPLPNPPSIGMPTRPWPTTQGTNEMAATSESGMGLAGWAAVAGIAYLALTGGSGGGGGGGRRRKRPKSPKSRKRPRLSAPMKQLSAPMKQLSAPMKQLSAPMKQLPAPKKRVTVVMVRATAKPKSRTIFQLPAPKATKTPRARKKSGKQKAFAFAEQEEMQIEAARQYGRALARLGREPTVQGMRKRGMNQVMQSAAEAAFIAETDRRAKSPKTGRGKAAKQAELEQIERAKVWGRQYAKTDAFRPTPKEMSSAGFSGKAATAAWDAFARERSLMIQYGFHTPGKFYRR